MGKSFRHTQSVGDLLPTHLHYFYKWAREKPGAPFLRQPEGKRWHLYTWGQAYYEAGRMASALQVLGLQKGTTVGLLSKNCAHWILADLAILMGGGVSVPFFPNITAVDLSKILEKSEVRYLFVGKLDVGQWARIKDAIPDFIQVIRFPPYTHSDVVDRGLAWEELVAAQEPPPSPYEPTLDDVWTILFTSGTTGSPKGVVLRYRSPYLLMKNELEYADVGVLQVRRAVYFSYLPLNHIAERLAIELACLYLGGEIAFAESVDTFLDNLRATQPGFFFAVPRIWQRLRLGILERFGERRFWLLMRLPGVRLLLAALIRRVLGLSKAELILTGASQTPDSIKQWFLALGLYLRDVYAMTENCAGCTVMPRDYNKLGTVGKPLHNVEIRIDPSTSEILMRAPWLMDGYYKDPEATTRILRDGWLYTGDTGQLDEEGFLKVTGRVSDTFKTAKGLFVVPAPLEEPFAENPFVEQVCVVGLGLPQPIALICPSPLAREASTAEVEKALLATLEKVNAVAAPHQRLSKIILLAEQWSVENGFLTPTLKVRRHLIDQRYQKHYEAWLAQKSLILWHQNTS